MPSAEKPVCRYDAAGGVVVYDGRVLLLARPARNEIRLPKGHVEPGETVEEAALRETREEGGLAHPRLVTDLGSQQVQFVRDGIQYIRQEYYFLMALEELTPYPRDPKDIAQFHPFWASFEEAAALLTFPTEREFLRRALAALGTFQGT